jgi:RNA methyltransferase, TrmH family
MLITSLQNPLVKRAVALRDGTDRRRLGLFVIEGEKEFLHAVAGGVRFDALICCGELMADNALLNCVEALAGYSGGADSFVAEVTPQVYAKIAYRQNVGGIIALAHIPQNDINTLKLSECPLVLVIAGVEKPGNIGALLRTADGVGFDAVIVVEDGGADLYNPNVIRASLGAIFTVKVFSIGRGEAVEWLRSRNIRPILTSPDATEDYTAVDYSGAVAIVVGSESGGLPEEWLQSAGCKVKIPMNGQMDSLNVSCAGAVIMYEALRQRNTNKG